MGCFSSKEQSSSASLSTSAAKQQGVSTTTNNNSNNNNGFKEKTKTNPIYKILLLGAGESGKSTIVKQMKIIHQNGYSLDELALYRTSIYRNLLDACHAVLEGMHHLALEPAPDNAQKYAYLLSANVDSNGNEPLDPKIVEAAAALYKDPVYEQIITHDSEFYIMDSTSYFLQNVERIGEPDYIPSETDILRARIKTTGVYETEFSMGSITIHLVDVGGQRSERKKWIHFFDNVTSIIFCVALSEYDQGLLEKNGQNRMQESLVLFESIVNSRWFARTSIILFLNKIDIFKEKILRSPMDKYFPDYTGGPDVKLATKYILYRFSQANHSGLNLYPHLTQATDTSNIRLVFAAVKETILQNALRDSGIL